MRIWAGVLAAGLAGAGPAVACDYPDPPPGLGQATEAEAQTGDILWAGFSDATTRYGHGVLGDAIEAGGLRAQSADLGPCDLVVLLPPDHVFEDIAPRIIDLDGDGRNEIVVIETDIAAGAALAVYGLRHGRLTKLAETPHIGRTNRWLAPIGAADLDGDGTTEIAYIDRPHLARTLRIWTYADESLRQIASAPGLTNHRIAEPFITGGIRDCGDGPEIVTANTDWRYVMVSVLTSSGTVLSIPVASFSTEAIAAELACR